MRHSAKLHLLTSCFLSGLLLIPSTYLQANVVGADTQNFNPTTNGLDFVTVQSSETLEPGIFNLGLFLNFATNSLPNLEEKSTQNFVDVKDTLTSADFHIGLGLMPRWDVGISFPQVIGQSVSDSDSVRQVFDQKGLTEIKANTKFRLTGENDGGIAVVASTNIPLIDNNPFTGTSPKPIFNLELAGDTTSDNFAIGFNLGYRFRQSGVPISGSNMEPLKSQWIASTAASYLMKSIDTKFIAELFGSRPAQPTQFVSDRDLSSLELLLGAKWDVKTQWAVHLGTGYGLIRGAASPDFRVYTGVNYTFGPMWGNPTDQEVREAIARREEPAPSILEKEEPNYNDNYFVIDNNADVFDRTPTAPLETFVAREILFEFNSSEIKEEFYPILAKLANYLQKGGGFKKLVIEGHTDSVGSDIYNQKLSKQRAESVRKIMLRVTQTPASKVDAVGFGESRPIADNGNYQGRQLNRRVEFKIYRDIK